MNLFPKLACLGIFILLTLTQITSKHIFEAGYISYAAIFVVGILASAALFVQLIRVNTTIHYNLIDLSFFAFVFLLLLRWLLSDNTWIYSKAAATICIVPIYIFVKQYKPILNFQWALIFTGVLQIIVSVLQKLGCLQNNNNSFEVGETVGNPNMLATLLLFTLISAIYLLSKININRVRNFLWFYMAIALLVIVLSKCRTAFLGSMIIGIFMLLQSNKNLLQNKIVKRGLIALLALISLRFIVLIFEKSGSITGRILIWQVSFAKIAESPFWGQGISSFYRIYPEAQCIFLENNSDPAYLQVADTPKWVYNDFIELWLEGGLFLTLSFLSILGTVLYCWKSQKRFIGSSNYIAFLSVIIFFAFSAFNFALTAWPVLLIFVINLAWSSSICPVSANSGIKSNPFSNITISLALLIICIYLGKGVFQNLSLQYQFNQIESMDENQQREFFDNHISLYQHYAPFVFKYTTFLNSENKTNEAIAILRTIDDTQPSYQSVLLLAENYQRANDLENAKINYEKAIKFLPNRILPRYHLFMNYLLMNNYSKADSVKKEALHLNYKGDTLFINQIKESLCKYNFNEKNTDLNQ